VEPQVLRKAPEKVIAVADNEPFGLDPEDLERVVRGAGEQLRGALGQFGRMFEGSGERAGWSAIFDDVGRRSRKAPEPETTGETGDGGAQIEQVYATELDALRANKQNTDSSRKVRFLPYGLPVSVLDASEDSPNS